MAYADIILGRLRCQHCRKGWPLSEMKVPWASREWLQDSHRETIYLSDISRAIVEEGGREKGCVGEVQGYNCNCAKCFMVCQALSLRKQLCVVEGF